MFKVQKWDLLVAVYVFCIVASELMGAKTFLLFQYGSFVLNASVAIFLFPLIFTINDIIIEVHGKERARSGAGVDGRPGRSRPRTEGSIRDRDPPRSRAAPVGSGRPNHG